MILIIADRCDSQARALRRRWAKFGAQLVTPDDLTRPGWRFIPGRPEASVAVVGGQTVPVGEIEGIVTRIAGMDPDDLVRIGAGDRCYAAAEITAFLIAWLSELPCPVLNRPREDSLNGPPWSAEEWLLNATILGIPVVNANVTVGPALAPRGIASTHRRKSTTVNVIGDRCIGVDDERLREQTRRLARIACVESMSASFRRVRGRYLLQSANQWADICHPQVADEFLRRLSSRSACGSATLS